MPSNYEPIGQHIRLVDVRNSGHKVERLVGLSITKRFIPSVANTVGTDMSNYKIIKKGQFACSIMQVRRDGKMPVALMQEFDEAIISQAYPVFEVIDETKLLPEYLMMWMSRSEFDRHACFLAVGGVRGSLEWDDFLEMELPVPHIDFQRAMVKEYNTITQRIALNEQLNQKLEETAQTLYRHWFVDFEFPYDFEKDEPSPQGKPYKSSGGEMQWCEELEKEIPRGWEARAIKNFCQEMKSGGTPDRGTADFWTSPDIPWLKTGEISNNVIVKAEEYISLSGLENSSAKFYPLNSVLMAMYGVTAGQLAYLRFSATSNQACCAMVCKNEYESTYLFYNLLHQQSEIANLANGGAQSNLSQQIIGAVYIAIPPYEVIEMTPFIQIVNATEELSIQNLRLQELSGILLSKMSTVETGVAGGVGVG